MSSSSVETTNLFEEERRAFEEIEQFEELEKECAMNRRGIRVKFDDERLPSMAQTTIVKSEPYFQINSIEDQVTKHFYHNEFPLKDLNDEQNHHSTDNSVRTLSELDSLEEKDQFVSSSPGRSILKKSMKKRQTSPSPHSDSNEMIHLAEVTGKQIHSQPPCPVRSLFEPTINIFDSSPSSNQSRRPSRLRYYIKPYRGDVYIPPERSRSLSEQRIAGPTVWYTFTNQYNRKNHVSWSPVRDYIHQGREKTSKQHQNKLSKQSSTSSPCLRTASSVTPVYSSQNSPASFTSLPQYEEKKQISSLPDLIHLPTSKKKHSETMQRYDRLLEKMKATDEQLQTLSRTWTTNLKQRTTVCIDIISRDFPPLF